MVSRESNIENNYLLKLGSMYFKSSDMSLGSDRLIKIGISSKID